MRIAFSLKQLNETPPGTPLALDQVVTVVDAGQSPDGQPLVALKYDNGEYASWNQNNNTWKRSTTVGQWEKFSVPKSGIGAVSHVNPAGGPPWPNIGQVHAWPCVPAAVPA